MAEDNYWLRLNRRSLSRRTALRGAFAGGVGLAVGMAACGGDDDEEAAEPTSTPTKEEQEKQEKKEEEVKSILWQRIDTTAQAVKGGIYQSYTTADVTNLDPLSSPSFTAAFAGCWYYPRLLTFKPGYRDKGATGEVQGYLGASWQQPEPTTLIFKLQPNAVWDEKLNKRPIDADDVVFSWNKFAAKGISRKDLVKLPDNPNGAVESIEAVDKTTVKFKLAYPYAPLLPALAYSR